MPASTGHDLLDPTPARRTFGVSGAGDNVSAATGGQPRPLNAVVRRRVNSNRERVPAAVLLLDDIIRAEQQ
jgi:hypothetical protein